MTTELTIPEESDFHHHFREGELAACLMRQYSSGLAYMLAMPNAVFRGTHIFTPQQAREYGDFLAHHAPSKSATLLMTLYLTDNTDPAAVRRGIREGIVAAVKYYPAGATTNSDEGVNHIQRTFPVLKMLEETDVPLLMHGEEVWDNGERIDVFDREQAFLPTYRLVRETFPRLKIVLEHITTANAADAVWVDYNRGYPTAATITPHHAFYNRDDMLGDGIRPDLYCKPILKRREHMIALQNAMISGVPCFFAGTDSAPHPAGKKYCPCGCAGVFNAPSAVSTYLEVFERHNMLELAGRFLSLNGPRFYGLPEPTRQVTYVREPYTAPERLAYADTYVPAMRGGEILVWQRAD